MDAELLVLVDVVTIFSLFVTEMTNALNAVEAVHAATVLEDCVDQLAILGRIMPVAYHGRPNATQVCIESAITCYELSLLLLNGYSHFHF